jgi:glutaconyl-CoA/methylmalonyl-CoA decarboxylase subunit gamma
LKLKIVIEDKAYEVEVDVANEGGLDPSTPVTATIQSEVLPTAGKPDVDADPSVIRSPLAGLVARVNVKPGQQVQPREVLLVLESMKMESSVMAQRAGTVKSVDVAPGNAVKVGQELIHFE